LKQEDAGQVKEQNRPHAVVRAALGELAPEEEQEAQRVAGGSAGRPRGWQVLGLGNCGSRLLLHARDPRKARERWKLDWGLIVAAPVGPAKQKVVGLTCWLSGH